ncbi:uracil phosphoribosyltransferase [Bacillus licheniformis]|nr:uracil phosphoribosyltransferase [Bacillus licheniformis]
MAFEITRDLPLEEVNVETPVQMAKSNVIAGKTRGCSDSESRAWNGRRNFEADSCCKVGHVGLYRDPETLKPVEYYVKLPSDVEEREFIVVDPMLATGGSAVEALNSLKNAAQKYPLYVSDRCPEGVDEVQKHHPDVDIYIAALDEN